MPIKETSVDELGGQNVDRVFDSHIRFGRCRTSFFGISCPKTDTPSVGTDAVVGRIRLRFDGLDAVFAGSSRRDDGRDGDEEEEHSSSELHRDGDGAAGKEGEEMEREESVWQ